MESTSETHAIKAVTKSLIIEDLRKALGQPSLLTKQKHKDNMIDTRSVGCWT